MPISIGKKKFFLAGEPGVVFLLTLELGPGAETHGRPFRADGIHDRIDHL